MQKDSRGGIPEGEKLKVASDFRLIPPPDLYSPKEKNVEEEKLRMFYGELSAEHIKSVEDNSAGTQFEMLKTAIMHKHMGERFIVVRSTRYDDYANGVDNILVDKQSGETVCAFDEVNASFRDKAIIEKTSLVLGKNFGTDDLKTDLKYGIEQKTNEPGVKLKYGIKITSAGKIECAEMKHLPIFLLGVDYDHLNDGKQEFINGEGKSRTETVLFKYFLRSLAAQIQFLKSKPSKYDVLPEELRKRVESFDAYIDEALKELK